MAAALALKPVQAVGRLTLSSLRQVGALTLFGLRSLLALVIGPWFPGQVLRQLAAIGFYSLPVIGLTAVFTGAALALNIYTGGGRFNAEQIMPQIVALGITRELGPVLAALMLAGRVSATIAAEIGAMRATEQIDALRTLSTDPYGYLVTPRLVAAVIALPLLTLVADIIGIAGGWGVAVGFLDFNPTVYIRNTVDFVEPWDVGSGLIKAMVFGFIVALMGCYHGYRATGGARGVGRATTQAVVTAAIAIFASDYVLTTLFTAR
ncbi:ABC transporter permease [Phenylobacterium sp.]|uniref:MlaE family ABC transporter permease n=1 Tax=Phenylobacterium sp. TaxID=1871053 RepID=UPI0030F46F25